MQRNSKTRATGRPAHNPSRSTLTQPTIDASAGPSLPQVVNTPGRRVTVSIVSNSRLLYEGLKSMFVERADISMENWYSANVCSVATTANLAGAMVLIDAGMGLEKAVEWTHYWRRQIPPVDVIVLELANDPEIIVACIEAGASGYTLQGSTFIDMLETLHRVQRGLVECSREVLAHMFERRPAGLPADGLAAPLRIPLTARELDVLQRVSDGCSNREIADLLVIEVHTVKYHIHNILEKLKVAHRWDAVRLAQEQGWIESHGGSAARA